MHHRPCIYLRRPKVSLHDIAPRLARARDGLIEERRVARLARERFSEEKLRLERLLAHRELQLARAYVTDSGRYIAARQGKLREAKGLLARHIARHEQERAA